MTRGSAVLGVVAAGVLFSTGGAAVKLTEWHAWQIAGTRSAVAALALFLALPEARRRLSWKCLPVGVAYAATLVLFVHANKLTTAAATIFLQATSPVWVVVLGPVLLRERLRRVDLALLPAFAAGLGILLTVAVTPSATAPQPALGNLLAALSGLCYAFTVVGLRWLQSGDDGGAGPAAAALGNAFAALACLPWAWPLAAGGVVDYGVVLYLGVFQIAFAYWILLRSARQLTALEVALLLLAEPVLSPLWAYWLHAERPGLLIFVGGGLIVFATVIKAAWEARSGGELDSA
ncbi:MAG: DMT family transporter [Acidobacteriota bacterium]